MTRDDIIRMARDAGSIDSEEVIETVWRAFSAAEREACAKVCVAENLIDSPTKFEVAAINKCAAAMQADFEKAGKVPPEGMVDFTCTCVVQKIFSQQSITQAKNSCTKLALQKYGQP